MQSRGVAAGAPSFQELFQYPDLADDVERSVPIEAFLRLLAEVAADGRELVRTACAAFLARHRSARDAGAAGAPVPATVAALRQRIAQGLQAHAWQGAALGFVEYVLDFFERYRIWSQAAPPAARDAALQASFADIGLTYLMIPIITTAIGAALHSHPEHVRQRLVRLERKVEVPEFVPQL